MGKLVRVLLVDDDANYASALRALLDREDWLVVVGEARDGRGAVDAAHELRPDVVLMDVEMPLLDGVSATSLIHLEHPEMCVLLVTGSDVEVHVRRGQRAGADGYVAKSAAFTDLVAAIRERCPGAP
jgi:DNA-binding NarL/FixJ family response regulator